MITLFFVFISLAVISSLSLNLFLLRLISKNFSNMLASFNSLQKDLCLLKQRIQKIIDEVEEKGQIKNLSVISEEEREERWNRIRKAFDKKEKERDGSN